MLGCFSCVDWTFIYLGEMAILSLGYSLGYCFIIEAVKYIGGFSLKVHLFFVMLMGVCT